MNEKHSDRAIQFIIYNSQFTINNGLMQQLFVNCE